MIGRRTLTELARSPRLTLDTAVTAGVWLVLGLGAWTAVQVFGGHLPERVARRLDTLSGMFFVIPVYLILGNSVAQFSQRLTQALRDTRAWRQRASGPDA